MDHDEPAHPLRQARLRCGWSQRQAMTRFEALGQKMKIGLPAPTSLRALFSMYENGRRAVPDAYRPIFRELYRASDSELGFSQLAEQSVHMPEPLLPADLPDAPVSELLGYLSDVLDVHIRADAQAGPRFLLAGVTSQLPLIERLCQTARRDAREPVLTMAVRFTEFCGWLGQDLGHADLAVNWTNRALEYAEELGDRRLGAYVLMRKSNIATESGSPGHGLGLAKAALRTSHALTPRIRAVALRQVANAYALLGEQAVFERSISEALEQSESGDQSDPLAGYCTTAYVEMEAAASWVHLGQPGSAIDVFEDSLGTWPACTQIRDRGLCLARLAAASAAYGDSDRAWRAAAQALPIARSTGSARIRQQLLVAVDSLAARKDPDVQDLSNELGKLRTAHTR